MQIFHLIIAIFLVWSCKSPEQYQPTLLQLSDNHNITFLDSTRAASAIVSDTMEHFFDQIKSLDMSIQLKRNLNPSMGRAAVLEVYKNDLKEDVLTFTPEEISFIENVF